MTARGYVDPGTNREPGATSLPRHVQVLLDFTNSVDRELGTDELTTPRELSHWLHGHGLLPRRVRATAADLDLALALRRGLHAAFVATHDGTGGTGGTGDLAAAAADLPLRLTTGRQGPVLAPVQTGVPGGLSQLLVAVNAAQADGTWQRLKVCSADFCAWAYLDTTKNRSKAYCEWGCGNRIKTRNYRARKKQDPAAASSPT